MSSNLTPSLPSGHHRSAAAHAVESLSGVSPAASLNARGQGESDSQAFARWMAQYSQAHAVPASTPQPSKQAVASQLPSPPRAPQAQPQGHHADTNGGKSPVPVAHAEAAKPQAQARPAAKAPIKPATAKAPEAPRQDAKADKAGKDPAADPAVEADQAGEGQAVAFSTAQGEATAYVKELQPPAHVTPGDPAAMLAWLATLAQAKASPPAEAGESEGGGSAGTASALASLGADHGGRASQPSWAVQGALLERASAGQGAGQDGAAQGDAGQGQREGAIALEALGMAPAKDSTPLADAASFGTLMNQALARTPEGLTRQEATHHTDSLPTPLSSPDFAQAFSDKVGMWVTGAAQEGPMTAELRLNPAEMGPVHIRIELDGQTANVDFAAQALETRQAIEASLPMLSEALSEAGLSLSGGGVSDQPQQQAWSQAERQASMGQGPAGRATVSGPVGLNADGLAGPQTPTRLPRGRAGGLDLYA